MTKGGRYRLEIWQTREYVELQFFVRDENATRHQGPMSEEGGYWRGMGTCAITDVETVGRWLNDYSIDIEKDVISGDGGVISFATFGIC